MATARRLWAIYLGLVECLNGSLDQKTVKEAIVQVALEAGALDKRMDRDGGASPSSIGERLMMELDPNSNAWVVFSAAYGHRRK